jgi:hypothetical protein
MMRDVTHTELPGHVGPDITTAKSFLCQIMKNLDDICRVACDGVAWSYEDVELLSLLRKEALEQVVSRAEAYAENVRDYATLAQEALAHKERAGARATAAD